MKIFGREPVLWLALVAGLVQLLSSFWLDLSGEQQGVLNALAVAVIGAVTAFAVAREKVAPALLGLVQAALAVGLAFGWDLSAQDQSTVMAFSAAVIGMFLRTQVTAPVSAAVADRSGPHAVGNQ